MQPSRLIFFAFAADVQNRLALMRQLSYNKKVCSFKPVERLNMSMKQEFAFMIILSAQHIAKSFGVNAVLRDVSLTVQQGDRIGFRSSAACASAIWRSRTW